MILVFSVSPCVSLTCLNDGTCVVDAGLSLCVCKGNYSGSDCAGKNKFHKSLTNFITQCYIKYISPWVGLKLTTCTDWTCSYKSNYHN
jgi:hypothetical protein